MPQELKKRAIFTLLILCLYRLGTYIPVPGVDAAAISEMMAGDGAKSIFGMANLFSGGAIERISVFSLSMMPYITASIVVQLLSTISSYFKSLKEEGATGRRKLNQITRYFTIILAFIQALAVHFTVISKHSSLVVYGISPIASTLITSLTLIGGAVALMWFGERISLAGLGNGISVLVLVGIISSLPSIAFQTFGFLKSGFYTPFSVLQILVILIGMLLIVCFVEKTYRMIKINYPTSSAKGASDNFSFLPLKVNVSGVIPPIFASSVMMFFSALVQFLDLSGNFLSGALSRGGLLYGAIFSFLIVFFSYFYSSIVFDSEEMATNLKKSGCFLSGIRPGKATANKISSIISKLVAIGSVYLVFVCIVPEILVSNGGVNVYIGGTGILIIVNVASDLASQVRSHFINQKYGINRIKRKRIMRKF